MRRTEGVKTKNSFIKTHSNQKKNRYTERHLYELSFKTHQIKQRIVWNSLDCLKLKATPTTDHGKKKIFCPTRTKPQHERFLTLAIIEQRGVGTPVRGVL
jgi:hypothetical protein